MRFVLRAILLAAVAPVAYVTLKRAGLIQKPGMPDLKLIRTGRRSS